MKLFKKLALVLSAVMVITLIPAKTTYAAKEARLAFQEAKSSSQCITEFELKLGKSQDLKFYGVGDYKTTGIGWESSNDAVATVDKNGVVTAKGVGSAAIIYKAKGYTSIPATVVVTTDDYNVYLAEQLTGIKYTAYNLQPGKQVDFKFIGASGWTVTRYAGTWASTDETVAVVDKNGLVTARKEGQCQIVLTLVDKKTGKVAFNVKPCTVTVGSTAVATATPKPSASATPTPQLTSAFSVKQTSYNEAEITFKNTAIKASEINLAVADGANYISTKSDVKDGKMTVKFTLDFQDGKEYTITNGNDKYTFKASVGNIAAIKLSYSCDGVEGASYENEQVVIKAQCVDANGIVVKGTPTLTEKDDYGEYEIYDNTIWMGIAGERKTITAKITSGGKTITASTVITAKTVPAYSIVSAEARIAEIGTNFSAGKQGTLAVAEGDENKGIALKITDNRGKTFETVAGTAAEITDGFLMFSCNNYNILEVDDDGTLYTYGQGTASVKVIYVNEETGKQITIGTYNVLVQAPSYITSVSAKVEGPQGAVISATNTGNTKYDKLSIVYSFKDQYGNEILPDLGDPDLDVDYFSTNWKRDEVKKTLTLELEYTGGIEASVATKSVAINPIFTCNFDYNEREYKNSRTNIKIVNFDKEGAKTTTVVVKDPDSATSLGAAAGSDKLTVGAILVKSLSGAYLEVTDGIVWDENKAYTDLGAGIYYHVEVSSTSKKDAWNNFVFDTDVYPVTGGVEVKVRDAIAESTPSAISSALKSQGNMTVKISFFEVKDNGTKKSKSSIGTTQSFSLSSSNVAGSTVSIVYGSDMTAEYLPTENNSLTEWLETHAVVTIHNAFTGKDIVLAKEGDFLKYGVVINANISEPKTNSSLQKDYVRVSKIEFFFETEKDNGGWISATNSDMQIIYEKEY